MKVGIFGSYNQGSIGDYAILHGIIHQFLESDPLTRFIVFASDSRTARDQTGTSEAVQVVSAFPYLRSSAHRRRRRETAGHQEAIGKGPAGRNTCLRRLCRVGVRLLSLIKTVGRDVLVVLAIRHWRTVASDIRSADLLIIGGGNLVMDLYPTWPVYPLIYALLGRLVGTPVVFYGVGAGPISTLRGRLHLACACHLARLLTFRDQESLDLVRGKLRVSVSKLILAADPALHLRTSGRVAENTTKIGITFVPYFSPDYWPQGNPELYRRYSRAGATALRLLSDRDHTRVSLLATNYPHDMYVAREVARGAGLLHSPDVLLLDAKLRVADILDVITQCDIIVGTRLHSLVLAVVAGVPFVAISYQPKVASFVRRCGMEDYLLDISEFIKHPEQVIALVEQALSNRGMIASRLAKAAEDLRENSRRGHQHVLKALAEGCWP